MSAEDKRKLCTALSYLSDEDLVKVLGIIAESNPSFQAMSEEVDINLDEQVNILFVRCHLKFLA